MVYDVVHTYPVFLTVWVCEATQQALSEWFERFLRSVASSISTGAVLCA